ncbi:cupin domain-containing protein [candidate division KSB1 bacterium]|nr:cupin domain-containing protein [candidate division KSB1 bacterium]
MNKIDLEKMMATITEPFVAYDIFNVNNATVRLVKISGKYHWHKHDDKDELFMVLKGEMNLNFEHETIHLKKGEAFLVKRGVKHESYSEKGAIVMMVEPLQMGVAEK